MNEQWGNNTDRETNETLRDKTCLSAKSHTDWPKIEPGTPKLPEKPYFPKMSH